MNSAPVASGIGVFPGEVEGVVCRECHFGARVEGSGGNVAVDADGEGVALPVVGVAGDELAANVGGVERENSGQLVAGGFAELLRR